MLSKEVHKGTDMISKYAIHDKRDDVWLYDIGFKRCGHYIQIAHRGKINTSYEIDRYDIYRSDNNEAYEKTTWGNADG